MTAAYSLRNVTYTYGGSPVLDIGQMRIPEGEIVALVGPNGSGKTTLLHLLAFLEMPQTGEIQFFGEKTHAGNLLALRRKAGLLLQNPYLFHETVMSNMIWGLRLRGISSKDAERASLKALEMVGLAGFENRYARSLSGGESQRVALARALVLEPVALLLDEPSNHMDRASAERTEEIVMELNRKHGRTVVIATHAVDKTLAFAHQVIHLWEGKIVSAATDNLFRGVLQQQGNVFDTGNMALHLEAPASSGSFVTIDPSQIEIRFESEPQSANSFPGTVVALSAENGQIRVDVDAGERVRVLIPSDSKILPQLRLGLAVWVVFSTSAVKVI
jgi:energy-coupling factor transporter ATP-binding protein EcfA2